MSIVPRMWLSAAAVVCLTAMSVRALEVGDAAPPIELDKWVVGDPVNPGKPDGKSVYLIEFWQIPCPPCEEASRALNALYKTYKDKGLKIVAVNAEDEAVTRERLKNVPNDFPSAIDGKGTVFKPYMDDNDRDSRPFAFVTDKAGKILWMGLPTAQHQEMVRVVKGALDGTYTLEKAKEIAKYREELNASLQLRDPEALLANLEKLAKADPENPQWLINIYNVANELGGRTGNTEKADAALKKWKTSFLDDAGAQAQLAITLMSSPEPDKRDPSGALAAARRAAELDNANPMLTLAVAQLLMDIGRLDDAAKVLNGWKGASDEMTKEHGPLIKQYLSYIDKLKAVREEK